MSQRSTSATRSLPQIDPAKFKLYAFAKPLREKDGATIQFLTYFAWTPRARSARPDPRCSPRVPWRRGCDTRRCSTDLIKEIMEEGNVKGDRTGTGTISKFGCQQASTFVAASCCSPPSVSSGGAVAEELIWSSVKGCTSAKELQDKDIHIWDGNGSREYPTAAGLGHRG